MLARSFACVRLAVLTAAIVSLNPTAFAIALVNGLGGPEGYGPHQLAIGDDNSSDAIDLTGTFPGGVRIFENVYPTFYVNANGNISFGSAVSRYTPIAFPAGSQAMIAAWWGDVDIRSEGVPMGNAVWWYLDASRIIVTWDNVGYFNRHTDLVNSFQLLLSANPVCPGVGNFQIEFRYAACNWTTGDASGGYMGLGGTPAEAGWDAGDLNNYYAIPESLSPSILDVCTTSNVGVPGDWIFSICACPGVGAPCTVPGQLGVCAQGVVQCTGPNTSVCMQVNQPSMDTCDGIDHNCDGVIDPPLPCYDGPIGTEGVGACRAGQSVCVNGMRGACLGEVTPSPETCDGVDTDCNGMVDDVAPRHCYTGAAGSEGVGLCHGGTQTCHRGMWGSCVGEVTQCQPEPGPDVQEAAQPACGGDPRCDPSLRIQGRAGPIGGCYCRADPSHGNARVQAAGVILVALALVRSRRRRA